MNFQFPKTPYCVLLGNGEYPDKSYCHRMIENADLTICSDGGANFAQRTGIIPHMIIGDLDSISNVAKNHFTKLNVPILLMESQRENDLEKAINYIMENHTYNNIVLLGFLGLRDDHSYATLQIAERLSDPVSIRIYSKTAEYLILPPGKHSLTFPINHTVSIFALPVVKNLITSGLKWNLNHEDLFPGSHGVSNIVIDNSIRISFDTGKLMLISPIQS